MLTIAKTNGSLCQLAAFQQGYGGQDVILQCVYKFKDFIAVMVSHNYL